MKYSSFLAGCMVLASSWTTADALDVKARQKYLENYNVQRAIEVMEENPREAYRYLDRETDENPENGYAWYLLARLFADVDGYGTVLEYSTRAITCLSTSQMDPEWTSLAYVLRASAYEVLGKDDLRLKDLNLAVKNGKMISFGSGKVDNSEAYSARAEYYYEKKQYALADEDYGKMLQLDPHNSMAYMGLGRDALDSGNYAQAEAYFRQAHEVDPDYPYYHTLLADALSHQGRYGETCEELVASINDPRTSLEVDMSLIVDSLAPVISDTLMAHIDRALKQADASEQALCYVATFVLMKVARYDDALSYMKRAADSEGPTSSFYQVCSSLARRAGKDTLALDYAMQAYECDSTDYDVHVYAALTLNDLGRAQEAERWCRIAIEEMPEDVGAYDCMTRIFMLQKRHEEALAYNDLALLLEPDNAQLLYRRSSLLADLGRKEELARNAEAALAVDTVPDTDCNRAMQLAYLGRDEEALSVIDETLMQFPHHRGEIMCSKAEVLLILGRKEDARQALAESHAAGFPRLRFCRQYSPFCDYPELFDNL